MRQPDRLLGLAVFFLFATAAATSSAPQLRLPDAVAPARYRVELSLDPDKPAFSGSVAIAINVKNPVDTIWLNASGITIQDASLVAGTKHITAKSVPGGDDFVGLQFDSPVAVGAAEIRIRYTGSVRHKNTGGIFEVEDNGNKYLYTQFEAIDARAAFPCFDEPSYKVPWQLTLSVPQSDIAVSNTAPLKEQTQGDRNVYSFAETKPLPSYLVAFAVGPFEFVDAGRAGKNHVPVRIVTPKGHADEAGYAAEVTATIITRLEDYFGIPFPYEKSDQVAIPVTFGFGAMENAGMVTYAQNIILAKPDHDTDTRRRRYASVAAHELAHQWFGDLVTTAWWNDIWLNEAFASWMQQKLIAEWKPAWKTRVRDVDSKLLVERQDSLVSARKIRQDIASKNDISNAFDNITYEKGAAVIGMFESWVGPDQFRKGVQAYLKQYAFRNASAPEFLDALSSVTHKNVTQAFSTFLNQPGVPLLSLELDCNANSPTLHLNQQRFLPIGSKGSTDELWQIPVCIRYGNDNSSNQECTIVTQANSKIKLKASGCPAWVEANDGAAGYYRVDYRGGLLSSLTKGDVSKRLNAQERVELIGNTEALAEAGDVRLGDALNLVQVFHNDPERHVVQTALRLALEPHLHLVPDSEQTHYQQFLRKNFQARARELGWVPQPGESDDDKLLRPDLLSAVSTYGGDDELGREARKLADRWLTDDSAIAPNMLSATLGTAAYYGDKTLFDKLLARLKQTTDRQERAQILDAMGAFRDPSAIEAGMNAVLSGDVPFIEGMALLFAGQESAPTRKLAFEFMRAHFDELAAKRPSGAASDAGARFPYVGRSFCDAQSKAELKNFFEPRIGSFSGAPRGLAQVLESIDLCIARKQTQQQSVEAFLRNY